MGLDISAYRRLESAPEAPLDGDGYPVDWKKYKKIHDSTVNWSNATFGSPPRADGVVPGIYRFAESMGFRAGSYSGYNRWRDWLAKVAGHGSAQQVWDRADVDGFVTGPFEEQIHFADNEGIIGPKVAAKLAKDYADHQERIMQLCGMKPGEQLPPPGVLAQSSIGSDDLYNLFKYLEWRKAFEMAADGGLVEFH